MAKVKVISMAAAIAAMDSDVNVEEVIAAAAKTYAASTSWKTREFIADNSVLNLGISRTEMTYPLKEEGENLVEDTSKDPYLNIICNMDGKEYKVSASKLLKSGVTTDQMIKATGFDIAISEDEDKKREDWAKDKKLYPVAFDTVTVL